MGFYLDRGRLTVAAGLDRGNAVGSDIKLDKMFIAAGSRLNPVVLADPSENIKFLLKSLRAA